MSDKRNLTKEERCILLRSSRVQSIMMRKSHSRSSRWLVTLNWQSGGSRRWMQCSTFFLLFIQSRIQPPECCCPQLRCVFQPNVNNPSQLCIVSYMTLGLVKLTISLNYCILYVVPKSQLRRGAIRELVVAGKLAPPHLWDRTQSQVPPGYKVVLQGSHVCPAFPDPVLEQACLMRHTSYS